MENHDLMPTMPQKLERTQRDHPVQQQIRNKNHESATTQQIDHATERRLGGSSPPRREAIEHAEQLSPMGHAGAGRRERAHLVIQGDEPGGVPLPPAYEGGRCNE